jgi:signal transduction histidine kinase
LTQQLLTFAKGGNPILSTVEIGSLLKETADFALRGSNVSINYHISQELYPVAVDEGQINQVIHNLILNAVQAMPNGGEITVSAQNFLVGEREVLPLDKGQYVQISVSDQGQGISPEHIDKVFDPYFSTKPMGSGLGLTTTFSVIKRHKGYITVNSKLEVGTTFDIFLPFFTRNSSNKLTFKS